MVIKVKKKKKWNRDSPNIPWRTSSAQGKSLKMSHGGNGICKKNPNFNFKFFSSAACLTQLAASIK